MSPGARPAEKGIPNALARFGFFARGIVYVVVGGLAARVAILQRGRTLGPAGALVAAGLIAYGLSLLVLSSHRLKRSR